MVIGRKYSARTALKQMKRMLVSATMTSRDVASTLSVTMVRNARATKGVHVWLACISQVSFARD